MSAEAVDVVENAWQRAKGRALRSEGCPAPSCREGTIEMLDLMHDELVNLPAKVAAQVGAGEAGTTLEYGRLRIRGKSAVTLAVKYGSFAVVVLAVLYLVARVHGWIPAPVPPQAVMPAPGPTVAADTRDIPAG